MGNGLLMLCADLPTLVNCQVGHTHHFPCRCPFPSPCPILPPHLPFPSPTLPLSLISSPAYPYPPLANPSNPQGGLGSAVSSPSRSGQSPATKRILVQRRPKLGIWRWVEGLAKWVNIFTNLSNLQWRPGSETESDCGSN